jgi:hypothetical protein
MNVAEIEKHARRCKDEIRSEGSFDLDAARALGFLLMAREAVEAGEDRTAQRHFSRAADYMVMLDDEDWVGKLDDI